MTWMEQPELAAYLARQRWFGAGDAEVHVTDVRPLSWLAAPVDGIGVRVELVSASAGGRPGLFNVPLSYRHEPHDELSYGFIGATVLDGEVLYVYDALHDPEARTVLVRGFAGGGSSEDLEYTALDGFSLEPDADTVLLSAEQSNTSVIAGEALIKFFRRLSPGRSPDIEVQAALTALGSEEISPLLGWITTGDLDLAMVNAYQRSATDGWDSARASVRGLQDDDVRARDSGGDFAAEAERLGATTALVHAQLREALPTASWGRDEIAGLVARWAARLEYALAVDATIAPLAERALAAYAAVDPEGPMPVQRVHGDFHLGQTLRTTTGWKIIDFEGEPTMDLRERIRPDSAMRDLAGMLRSLDYAAHSVALVSGPEDADQVRHADDWVLRNRAAFLRGYGFTGSPDETALLRAYEIDKAFYELVYETHHRPSWVPIPLRALKRLL